MFLCSLWFKNDFFIFLNGWLKSKGKLYLSHVKIDWWQLVIEKHFPLLLYFMFFYNTSILRCLKNLLYKCNFYRRLIVAIILIWMSVPQTEIYIANLIFFMNYFSSGVVWEMKPKQKWKPFSQKQIMLLEQSYKKYQVEREHGWIKLDNNFEVYQIFCFVFYICILLVVVVSKISSSK